ncbi:MAG: LptF/LptG family permease [PS1 clade bacterium]
MRNIFALLIAVFVVIGSIIFGNQLVLVFRDSIDAGIPISDLLPVVGFNMIRDIPLILSLSFFFGNHSGSKPFVQRFGGNCYEFYGNRGQKLYAFYPANSHCYISNNFISN